MSSTKLSNSANLHIALVYLLSTLIADEIFNSLYIGHKCRNMTYMYLTNRFYVAVRLFINRSQMTSKSSKNKKVAHKAIAECVTDVLTTF